ncbi:Protein CBG22822 [Caenorhabditis briggsae]|uniref:Protein CBG22822 n=1 Tax=Caenorhabditis briggsae TaxID=6238 RepID=A8Y350_CAEBR|nr:Protein CBG22822 [Caenorhabditis briggsae]CAP39319.2 Protein CBG22822 [Caenorhabditis briggsae]
MRKLNWNEELDRIVRRINYTSLKLQNMENWRFTFISNYTTGSDELKNDPITQAPYPNSTSPGPSILGNSERKFPETATLPKELEDYVEVDGDDYDEDFATGEPLLDSGFSNFLQFWITVLVVFGSCFFLVLN